MDNGGYYAIKGFAYQFDKSLLEILTADDETKEFGFEYLQDLNDDSFVMQIKHREATKYTDTAIREPVIQLIEAFRSDPTKEYVLYCHFKNKTEQTEPIDESRLNKILAPIKGKSKEAAATNKKLSTIDADTKKLFCQRFSLRFSPSFNAQFQAVLEAIKKTFRTASDDLTELHYSQLVHGIQSIILSQSIPLNRTCTRRRLLEIMETGKRISFLSAFKEYKGEKQYLRLINEKVVTLKRNQNNLIVFGNTRTDASLTLGSLIIDICERFHKKANHQIEPLTILLPRDQTILVKKELIASGIHFNDGYEEINFSETMYFQPPVKAIKIIHGKASDSLDKLSFKLRILSTQTHQMISRSQAFQRIYMFDHHKLPNVSSPSVLVIDELTTRQIAALKLT